MNSIRTLASWPALLLIPLILTLAGCGGGPDPNLDLGGIDMGEVLDGLLARTQNAVAGISGLESAKTANDQLRRINEDFDDFLFHLPKLNDEGRAELAKKSRQTLPDLQRIAGQVYEMPALDDIIGETLRTTVAKLEQIR